MLLELEIQLKNNLSQLGSIPRNLALSHVSLGHDTTSMIHAPLLSRLPRFLPYTKAIGAHGILQI